MTNILSRLFFYAALTLSVLLSIMLLSAAANFGLGQVKVAGATAILIVAVMLLNPIVFGLLGFIKGVDPLVPHCCRRDAGHAAVLHASGVRIFWPRLRLTGNVRFQHCGH